MTLADGALEERMGALARFLEARRALWEPRPYTDRAPDWVAEHPEVARWLRAQAPDGIDAIEEAHALPDDAPAALRAWAAEAAALTRVPRLAARGVADALPGPGRGLARGVKGRKWRQIKAFSEIAADVVGAAGPRFVDWCAGKGHLGRTVALLTGREARLVELSPILCADARVLGERYGARLEAVCADALTPAGWAALDGADAAVALHSCGGLGDALLREASDRDMGAVLLAPCCYHRLHGAERRGGRLPLSAAGRALGLRLEHTALRLATADEVVAPRRQREGRRRENAWRLGLDRLVREASGVDAYTPLGTVPPETLRLPFPAFCREVARLKGLTLPARWDAAEAERAGWAWARDARALGIVRSRFRRAIELFLVLDRAVYLRERGRAVAVAEFCAREVSPRNLMIRSERTPSGDA